MRGNKSRTKTSSSPTGGWLQYEAYTPRPQRQQIKQTNTRQSFLLQMFSVIIVIMVTDSGGLTAEASQSRPDSRGTGNEIMTELDSGGKITALLLGVTGLRVCTTEGGGDHPHGAVGSWTSELGMTAHLAWRRHSSSREKQDGASSAVSAIVSQYQLSGWSALFLLSGVSALDVTFLHMTQ